MDLRFQQLLSFGRTVTIEIPQIAYETETGILVEYNYQTAWLPKSRVKITRRPNSVIIQLPRWLYRHKF